MRRVLLTFIAVWPLIQTAISQPYCSVKYFDLRDGLASNVITGMTQTPDQLLWVSTWNGLTCYDGYHFTTFRDIPSAMQQQQRVLTTNRLQDIKSSDTGNIWCITYDLNAYLFDRRSGQYVDVTGRINKKFGITFHAIRAITTSNGHTWLLSNEKGGPIVCIDEPHYESDDAITLYHATDKPFLANEFFWVVNDDDGREYFFTDKGAVSIDGSYRSKSTFRFFQQVGQHLFFATRDGKISISDKQLKSQKPLALPADVTELASLSRGNDHQLIALTNAGIYIYDTQRRNGQLIPLPVSTDLVELSRTLYIDSRHRLWIGMAEGDVMRINLSDGTAEQLPSAQPLPLLKQSSQTFFHEDRSNTVWVATSQGFFGYYDEGHRQFVSCPIRTNITQPVIERWYFDAQGNLWFSGDHNMGMVTFEKRNIIHVSNIREVRSVMFDRHGLLWAGTKAGEIVIYDDNGKLQGYLNASGHISTQYARFSTHIYCLYQDRQDRVWIGTKGDGLYRIATDGTLAHYTSELPSLEIYDVHQDHQGRIWIGTFQSGICLMQEGSEVRFLSAPAQLKGYPINDYHKVRRITETKDGTIIVSASNGMVTFSERFTDPAKIRFHAHKHVNSDATSLLTSDVMQTFVTDRDSVFIATVGGGLQVVSTDQLLSDRLQFNPVDWLRGEQGTILSLLQDKEGNLWTISENCLNMFERSSQQLWSFGPSHIGEHTEFTESEPAFNPQTGQMALATTDGFICFQPKRLREHQFVPPLVFTGVQLHSQRGIRHMLQGDSLEVSADQRNLTVYFAALDYQDNHMISYAYRLEGVDNDWNNLGNEHSITFNHLPPGHHKLLVRSTNNYGTWVNNTQVLYIYAHPTFWESWWAKAFYVLLSLLAVGVAFWIYRLRTLNTMERKMSEMKTRFFTDVSHKLRTPLTLIGGPVSQVLQAGGLTDMARTHLEMVERNAQRMLELVNKMLTYSKEHHTYISEVDSKEQIQQYYIIPHSSHSSLSSPPASAPSCSPSSTRLLIVEDNDDLRQFLVSILQSDYDVMQACNGREGLDKAQTAQPDFILTDIMMPEMDGMEMVHRIKSNPDISHIPIVILSAKASLDDRIEGLRAGVNDYITKPFSATYLKQRMANIIQNQRLLQQNYLESIKVEHTDTAKTEDNEDRQTLHLKATDIVDADKQLMQQLIDYIEANLSNPDLKIEDLAAALCLSRTVFYNKVRTLVGMSPVELIRHIRIQHAEDMVAKSNEPFSQIAYAVGFSDPRYFGKCFKKQTGLTPSEYREKKI